MDAWLRCSAVVFDLDDTLLDHRRAAERAVLGWARQRGVLDTPGGVVARWFELEREFYRRFQARELTMQEQRRERVRRFLPGFAEAPDDILDDAFEEYWTRYRAHWRPFDDVRAAFRRAKDAGVAVGVLTNGDHNLQSIKFSSLDVAGAEVVFAASSKMSAAKPDRRAFDEMRELMGVAKPSTCAMVGDSWEDDVLGAWGAGWETVLLDRQGEGKSLEHPGQTLHTISSLGQLHYGEPAPYP